MYYTVLLLRLLTWALYRYPECSPSPPNPHPRRHDPSLFPKQKTSSLPSKSHNHSIFGTHPASATSPSPGHHRVLPARSFVRKGARVASSLHYTTLHHATPRTRSPAPVSRGSTTGRPKVGGQTLCATRLGLVRRGVGVFAHRVVHGASRVRYLLCCASHPWRRSIYRVDRWKERDREIISHARLFPPQERTHGGLSNAREYYYTIPTRSLHREILFCAEGIPASACPPFPPFPSVLRSAARRVVSHHTSSV